LEKNNLDHLDLLRQVIQKCTTENIVIIAHSMGGIIAKLCLNKYSDEDYIQKVKKVITIGTPWKGSMDAIKFLRYGSKVPEMSLITLIDQKSSKEISSFFPSVYQLLPNQLYIDHLKEKGILPCNFLGDYFYDSTEFFQRVFQKDFELNHSYMRVFDEFAELLNDDFPHQIQHHEIISVGLPTITVLSEKSNGEPHAYWEDGDGTVPVFSAFSDRKSSNYFPYFVRKMKHSLFTNYPSLISLVTNILRENVEEVESENLFFSLESQYYKKFSGYIQKVACPVNVSITDKHGDIIYGDVDSISEEEIKKILQSNYEVTTVGTTTYIIYDEELETDISNYKEILIEAYDDGPTSVSIDEYSNGNVIERNAFQTFDITPRTKATVELNDNINNSTLKIVEGDQENFYEIKTLELQEDKIIFPETTIELNGNDIVELDGSLYAKGEIKLSIQDITKGSFNVRETLLNINGRKVVIHPNDEQTIYLTKDLLKEGLNKIEYFSIDEFDNTEKKKVYDFRYIQEPFPKIQFYFDDYQYIISIRENPLHQTFRRILDNHNAQPIVRFEDEEGVSNQHVIYHNKKRKIEILLRDVFGGEEVRTYTVNEILAKKIIRGTASTEDIETFVDNLNIGNVKYKFSMTNTGNKGNHTSLNKENLDKCTAVEIINKRHDIKISKKVKYDVRFDNLTEHINVDSKEKYSFSFRVLDFTLDEYVENLNLYSTLRTNVNDEIYEEDVPIDYDQSNKIYRFKIDFNNTKKFLEKFWKKNQNLKEADILIKNKHTNISIRNLSITIINK
jgi:pimeloyl-ACP methyl ester carboxylesterase